MPDDTTGARPASKTEKAASKRAQSEAEVLADIAGMPEPDRSLAERLHVIITTTAPSLTPRLWYGMPAYALDGKVLCFFQGASKFKARYSTFGFQHEAKLDEGAMWPVAFALNKLGMAEEERITELVKRASG